MATLTNYRDFIPPDARTPGATASPPEFWTDPRWHHQNIMLEFSIAQPKTLIYGDMGVGKTYYALRYLENFDGLRLVLCPPSARVVYAADFARFYPHGAAFEVLTLDKGDSKRKWVQIEQAHRDGRSVVVVVNYETAHLMPLHRIPWTAAVADEAHKLASYEGKTSRKLAVMCSRIPYKVAMTGTPYADGYERTYGITRWLDPILPASGRGYPRSCLFGEYADFERQYTTGYWLGYKWIIDGYRNLPDLASRLRGFTLLVDKSVLTLPPTVIRSYAVDLPPDVKAQYDKLAGDAVLRAGDDLVFAPHVLARLTKLQQLTSSGELETEAGDTLTFDITPRLDVLRDILTELDGAPVVIFTRFKRDVELVSRIVHEVTGDRARLLVGGVDEHEAWQAGDGQVLIANLGAGSTGVRLFRAGAIIDWSYSYSLKDYLQSRARVVRPGQTASTVYVHQIVCTETVDADILDALARKAQNVDALDAELNREIVNEEE